MSFLPEPPLIMAQLWLLVNDTTVGFGGEAFGDRDIEPQPIVCCRPSNRMNYA